LKTKATEVEIERRLILAKQRLVTAGKTSPSIIAICHEAKISRAYVYASYPEIVLRLKDPSKDQRILEMQERIEQLEAKNLVLKKENAILARVCLELKLSLSKLISEPQSPRKKRIT